MKSLHLSKKTAGQTAKDAKNAKEMLDFFVLFGVTSVPGGSNRQAL
jgi:hypothetical protein